MLPLSLSLPDQGGSHWLAALAINALLIALAQRAPLLTPQGWVHAGLLGTLLWGSALVAAILAGFTPLAGSLASVLLIGFAASLCAKLADTFGSEIGKRWGRHTLLITTLRPVPRGTEGAISLEGTVASALGSGLMAAVMAGLGVIETPGALLLVTAVGVVATLVESLMGATLQPRLSWLTNEAVNALQTLVAALLAMGLAPRLPGIL